MGPKQVLKSIVLGLSTGFTDPFPDHLPQENAPLGCPHAPRDSWQLPDYRLIGGWQQLWSWLVNSLVTRPSQKGSLSTNSGPKSKDPKLKKSLWAQDKSKEAATFLSTSRRHPWYWGWALTSILASQTCRATSKQPPGGSACQHLLFSGFAYGIAHPIQDHKSYGPPWVFRLRILGRNPLLKAGLSREGDVGMDPGSLEASQ